VMRLFCSVGTRRQILSRWDWEGRLAFKRKGEIGSSCRDEGFLCSQDLIGQPRHLMICPTFLNQGIRSQNLKQGHKSHLVRPNPGVPGLEDRGGHGDDVYIPSPLSQGTLGTSKTSHTFHTHDSSCKPSTIRGCRMRAFIG